jgi:hypothetical protein
MISFEKLLNGQYRATLGNFSECGKTKKQAQENLFDQIKNIPSDNEPYILKDSMGQLWILWHEGRSWIYSIGIKGSCVICKGDKTMAINNMKNHMEQYSNQGDWM